MFSNILDKMFKKSNTSTDSQRLILEVLLDKQLVGTLTAEDGYFIFTYNSDFIFKIKGIDEKEVKTKHLLPFFSTRIPSKSRPEVAEMLDDHPLRILGSVGRKSATSPYIFKLQEIA